MVFGGSVFDFKHMSTPEEHFTWGILVVDCLKTLREHNSLFSVPFIDHEVIPNFDGTPDEIEVWFICTTKRDSDRFREECLVAATDALKAELTVREFPHQGIITLTTNCVSNEEIEAGGGRFYYFR